MTPCSWREFGLRHRRGRHLGRTIPRPCGWLGWRSPSWLARSTTAKPWSTGRCLSIPIRPMRGHRAAQRAPTSATSIRRSSIFIALAASIRSINRNISIGIWWVMAYFIAGRYEDAHAAADKTLRASPTYPQGLRLKVATCGLLGRVEEARTYRAAAAGRASGVQRRLDTRLLGAALAADPGRTGEVRRRLPPRRATGGTAQLSVGFELCRGRRARGNCAAVQA